MPQPTSHSLFGFLFSRLFRGSSPPESPSARPLEDRGRSLDDVLRAVEERTRTEPSDGSGPEPLLREAVRSPEQEALEQREAARARLEEDIQALHQRLGTGLVPADLEELGRWMVQHARLLDEPAEAGCERKVDHQVLARLFERAGSLAWERVEELVDLAGETWPAPRELVLGRPADDVPRVLEQHRRELESDFVASSAGRCADLVRGEVRAWSHYYPDAVSTLWREVALRGVASALRIQIFSAMLGDWEQRPPELEVRLAEVLDAELARARTLLDQGVQSLDQARQVTGEVERACAQVIPDMVWDFLGPRVRRQPNYPGSPAHRGASTRPLREAPP